MWLKIITWSFLSRPCSRGWLADTSTLALWFSLVLEPFGGYSVIKDCGYHAAGLLPGACECFGGITGNLSSTPLGLCRPGHVLLLWQGGAWSRDNPQIRVWLRHFAPCTSSWLFLAHHGAEGKRLRPLGGDFSTQLEQMVLPPSILSLHEQN